jgi:hypothetical protein
MEQAQSSELVVNDELVEKMDEYNLFKHKHSEIKLMTNYDNDYDFYCKDGLYVIFAEYYPMSKTEINPIHYDCCYWGTPQFNDWLKRNQLSFTWYNCCVGIVSRNDTSLFTHF